MSSLRNPNLMKFSKFPTDDLTLLKNKVQLQVEKENHSQSMDQKPQKKTSNNFAKIGRHG